MRAPAGGIMVIICNRLSAGKSHHRVTACTPAGGAFLFYEEKEPKVIQGCALKTRRTGTPARKAKATASRSVG